MNTQVKVPLTSLVRTKQREGRGFDLAAVATVGLSVAFALLIFLADAPREVVGVLVIGLVLTLLLSGVPIGVGMIVASLIGMVALVPGTGLASVLKEIVYGAAASWSLSVIPLFILMGIVLWKSGLSSKAFDTASQWLGRLPGGLAIATNFSGAGLAAASGSSLGITYALGRVGIPEMLKAGYKPSLATAVVASSGTLGQLIPPSILLVVYAGVAQVAVGPQLLAATIPGVLMAIAYAAMILVRAAISPSIAPRAEMDEVTWSSRFKSLGGIIPVALVVIVVIGGLAFGIFTPTESAAFGALVAILSGWFGSRENRRSRNVARLLRESVYETVLSTASIFLLIIGVVLLTRVLTMSRLTNAFTEWVVSMNLTPFEFLAMLVVVYLILGMFLDPLAMILLTVPILIEPLNAMNIDLIWFGVFLVILCEVGQLSPPIGLLSFVVHKIVQEPAVNLGHEVTLVEVFKGVMWFIVTALALLALFVAMPEIVLWLPGVSAVK